MREEMWLEVLEQTLEIPYQGRDRESRTIIVPETAAVPHHLTLLYYCITASLSWVQSKQSMADHKALTAAAKHGTN